MLQFAIRCPGLEHAREWAHGLAARIEAALHEANDAIGTKVSADARKLLEREVYSVPIPVTSGRGTVTKAARVTRPGRAGREARPAGSPKWKRDRALIEAETYRLETAGHASRCILTNACEHAAPRNALGGPPEINRAGRKAGVQRDQSKVPAASRSHTRSVQWQEQAAHANRGWIRLQYQGALQRVGRER